MIEESTVAPELDDDFGDVMADDYDELPVDEYRLSTRPGIVSGDS